jgi:hypothetical protein
VKIRKDCPHPWTACAESLEDRRLLAITSLRWENAAGVELADLTEVRAGDVVYIAGTTVGERGRRVDFKMVEDDVLFASSSYAPYRNAWFNVSSTNDVARFAWRAVWTRDAGGINDDPEYRLTRSLSTSDPVRSGQIKVTRERVAPTAPRASIAQPPMGGGALDFSFDFDDDVGVNPEWFDSGDVQVTGPNGFLQLATFLRYESIAGSKALRAHYRLAGPGGTWDARDDGIYRFTARSGQVRDFSDNPIADWWIERTFRFSTGGRATVDGHVFDDRNADGVWASGEGGLPDRRVFVDVNGNGAFDAAVEPSSATNASGHWAIGNLTSGAAHRVRLVSLVDSVQTGRAFIDVTPAAGHVMYAGFFGAFVDRGGDPDDRVGEPVPTVSFSAGRWSASNASIDSPGDVDFYRVSVKRGQTLAFDVDIRDDNPAPTLIRLFDAAGRPIATQAVTAYRDSEPYRSGSSTALYTRSGYVEHTFAAAGTYYVGVSAAANAKYDAVTGLGDVGTGQRVSYRLEVTNVAEPALTTERVLTGTLRLPNRGGRVESIVATLRRLDGASTFNIDPTKRTWVFIHGRIDNALSFGAPRLGDTMIGALVARRTAQAGGTWAEQVLTLDWQDGAKDNGLSFLGGSAWVTAVARWAGQTLANLGFAADKLNLIGHSWGSYVAHDLARSFIGTMPAAISGSNRRIGSLVALDPAREGFDYNHALINFKGVSRNSWAIFGNGSLGSAKLSGTALEAYGIDLPFSATPSATLAAHAAPRWLFTAILRQRLVPPSALPYFSLDRLLTSDKRAFQADRYSISSATEPTQPVFEAIFKATVNSGKSDLAAVSQVLYVPLPT